MIILSHRGYWHQSEEMNTLSAFKRSFVLGFGTETDIRDNNSILVISHDIPDANTITAEAFFELYNTFHSPLPLALNIKADGLQEELRILLTKYEIENYFVFDMAVPDGIQYAKRKFKTYTRHSEYEPTPPYYDLADGVWLDEFNDHWIRDEIIEQHLQQGKALCIVSPDLHKRDYIQEWQHYRDLEARIGKDKIMLCTDFPELAQEYFNE